MLRRKLFLRLGVLVLGFVAGAVVAIALLQGLLKDLDRMSADAATLIDGVQDLGASITAVDAAVRREGDAQARSALVERELAGLRGTLSRLGEHHVLRAPEGADCFATITALLSSFEPDPAAPRAGVAPAPSHASPTVTASLWVEMTRLGRIARRHVAAEQLALSRRLRLLIIGLTAGALFMVNVSVIVLLHTGAMILRPVAALVDGSRLLGGERFDHRVSIAEGDEFGELAHAYNRLAEQLQANEQRKMETLQQLAVTLNHELNNAMGIIELQLGIVGRRAGGDPAMGTHLREIRSNLTRIAQTVASLREVRRIVVTDYLPGLKMLDLPRCTEPPKEEAGSPPA